MYSYIYIYIVSHRKMRITLGVIANHFGSDLQYCESLLADLRIIFQIVSQKRPFLFDPHHSFRQNFPLF